MEANALFIPTPRTALSTQPTQPKFTIDVFNRKPAPNAQVAIKSFHMRQGPFEAAQLMSLGKTKAKAVVPRLYYSARGKYESYYIVMEYVPCGPLKQLHPTDFTPKLVARLEYAVYLLRKYGGVVHPDMHDDNILVCPQSGRVMLIDFGFASTPKTKYGSIKNLWADVDALSRTPRKGARTNLSRLADMWARLGNVDEDTRRSRRSRRSLAATVRPLYTRR